MQHIHSPWLCFLRRGGMCCQSNSYLRAGEWKQHNAQYAERLAPVKWQSQCVHMALGLCWEMHAQTLPTEEYPLSSVIPEGRRRRLGLNCRDMIDGKRHIGTKDKCLQHSLLLLLYCEYVVWINNVPKSLQCKLLISSMSYFSIGSIKMVSDSRSSFSCRTEAAEPQLQRVQQREFVNQMKHCCSRNGLKCSNEVQCAHVDLGLRITVKCTDAFECRAGHSHVPENSTHCATDYSDQASLCMSSGLSLLSLSCLFSRLTECVSPHWPFFRSYWEMAAPLKFYPLFRSSQLPDNTHERAP